MSDISNFERHHAVNVVEFADYLRGCVPPEQWPEAAAERDTWRQRLPYRSILPNAGAGTLSASVSANVSSGNLNIPLASNRCRIAITDVGAPAGWRKTGYDFGNCECLFAEEEACRRFAAFIPEIGFGEHYG